jgi:hypothetical protein
MSHQHGKQTCVPYKTGPSGVSRWIDKLSDMFGWDDDGHQPMVDLLLQLYEVTLTRPLVRPASQD